MVGKPIIRSNIPAKACFVNDKLVISWESENADNVEIVHNGKISAVSLNGSLVFTATENESFSFIVSNREWSLEYDGPKILVYAEDHFRRPSFITRENVFNVIGCQDFKLTFSHQKHHIFPSAVLLSTPVALCFFSLLSMIVHPSWIKMMILSFSAIWTCFSYYYVIGVLRKKSSIIINILFWISTFTGIAIISSFFRITTIEFPEIKYRLTGWVGAFLILIYLVSINNLKRIVYGKI